MKLYSYKVEPDYDINVGPYGGANIGADLLKGLIATTQIKMIPHFHPIL